MKLQNHQLNLILHLARFQLLDYPRCLRILDAAGTNDRVARSYAFRPLTKNGYLSKRKDGSVAILAKGRALFPEEKPLISVGGRAAGIRRGIEVSRMAALLEEEGIISSAKLLNTDKPYFILSANSAQEAHG